MRAVVCERPGPVDGFRVDELPAPEVRPGTVRLRVLAAGVSHLADLTDPGAGPTTTPSPFVPGPEFVGRITALAEDVARDAPHLGVGARVVARSQGGGFAEEAVVPAHSVTIVPDGLSDGQAATFAQSYLTAAFALERRVTAERGESMLVVGAGGGAGLAAVDVGTALRLRVFAAASTEEKRQLALDRGAEVALDVRGDDIERQVRELTGGDGVDHVYDPVGGERAETWLRCLGTGGRYLVVGFVAGISSPPLDRVLDRNRSVIGVDWTGWAATHGAENTALLHDLLHRISVGRLRPVEPTSYPLDRTVDALRDLTERRASGKLVIIP